jgi:hypothetical protein
MARMGADFCPGWSASPRTNPGATEMVNEQAQISLVSSYHADFCALVIALFYFANSVSCGNPSRCVLAPWEAATEANYRSQSGRTYMLSCRR